MLRIPLGSVIGAQACQYLTSIDYRAAGGGSLIADPALLFASLVKIVAVVILAIYAARRLVASDGRWHMADTKLADRYLGYILFVNLALAAVMVGFVSFLNSPAFALVGDMGVTKKAAKIVLLVALLAAITPFNASVFRDICRAIGSRAANAVDQADMPAVNKRFLWSSSRAALLYVAPGFVVHYFLSTLRFDSAAPYAMVAVLDGLLVAALAVAAGYAMVVAHREIVGSERFRSR